MPVRLKATEDLIAITDLRQNSARIVKSLRTERRPVVILQRGRAAAVLENVDDYEMRLQRLELLEAIVRGLEATQSGKLVDNREVMRRLKKIAVD
ncbi:MAG: type II toxin-antitoxin system Phd/YefM family antitoxin [Acidobacteriia bacterium]|nr:type II toxin-antitoxin system Phd/YefM family antitoxin [Terriglobia bacterium]